MKHIHTKTIASIVLSFISLGITAYQYKFIPSNFDFKIISGAAAILAFFIMVNELMKYTSNFQFIASAFASVCVGISIDNLLHVPPYITISLLILFFALNFRFVFRKWISESDNLWIDPVLFSLAAAFYAYGNISNDYGWRGWVYPAMLFMFSGVMIVHNMIEDIKLVKYGSKKKLIHEAGNAAPDFCLNDHEGNEIKLSDYNGKRDVLLMFVRSAWCPSCHIMLRTYQRNSEKFKQKNIILFAIGPNTSEVNKQMALDLGIEFKVLSDAGQKTAMAYRVHLPSEAVGEKYAEGMPLPASFLVDKKGIIRYTSRADRIGEFLDPNSIFPILESLN